MIADEAIRLVEFIRENDETDMNTCLQALKNLHQASVT